MEFKLRYYICILLLFLTTGCLEKTSSKESQKETYDRQVKEYDSQQEEIDRQLKAAAAQQNETEIQQKAYAESLKLAKEQEIEVLAQTKEYSKQLKIGAIQQARMDKVLTRWELQADRYDAILDKMEENSK